MRRDRDRIGTRLLRLSRRLGALEALPAEVAGILGLSPDVFAPLQYATLPGIGQVLWQDAARTTPVTTIGDPIGSALNIGTLGGYFEAAGAARPEWRGADGARCDGVVNQLVLDVPSLGLPVTHAVYVTRTKATRQRVFDANVSGSQHIVEWSASARWEGFAGTFQNTACTSSSTRAVMRVESGNHLLRTDNPNGSACGTPSTLSTGAQSMGGVRLGRSASDTTPLHLEGEITAYVRFARGVSDAEILTLPAWL